MATRNTIIVGCLFFAMFSAICSAQTSNASGLQSALMNSARDTKAAAFLDVQGCGFAFSQASGVADRKTKIAATVNMPLRLGSVGKLYTAAVIHKLASQGIINLDTPASRYLSANDALGVANRDATLRQLLNHTSGVPDYYELPDIARWDWKKPLTPLRILDAMKGVKATGAPGASYNYSNTGYHILALVAERAAGKPLSALIQSEVVVPLGLKETTYNVAAPAGALHGYVGSKDYWTSAENTGADSGVTATLKDVRTYLRALFIDAGPMRATGQAMTNNPVETGKPRQQAGAGAEVRTTREGLKLIGHTGDVEGYLSFAYVAPEYGLTMVEHQSSSDKEAFLALLGTTAQIVQSACSQSVSDVTP
jgi:D-alanyl-D-alanine carboxypeptidase